MAITINGTSGISGVDGTAGTPALQGTDSNTGISFGTDEVNINTGGSTRAKVDSSGRVLVGTSSFSGAARAVFQGNSAVAANQGLIYLQKGSANPSSVDQIGEIKFSDSNGSVGAEIAAYNESAWATNDYPTRLVFSVTRDGSASPTEAQRINNAGRAFFYAAGNGLTSASSTGAGTSDALFVGRRSATTTTDGTDVFIVYTNGNVQNTNGSYTTLSDQKLKENIVDASSQWDDLKAIQIRNWNFKTETGHETHRQIGPIAQELEQVCPGLVFDTPDRDEDGNETGEFTKGINQSVLYMKAVKALQEAMERIETLEQRLSDAGIA